MARYEDVKSRSLTGLAHAVDTRTKLKLDIRISPFTIVVSDGGTFGEEKRNLIADLGLLTITTIEEDSFAEPSVTGDEEADRREQLLSRAYEKFAIKLIDVQLIFSDNYRNGMDARTNHKSPFHLLKPTKMDIAFHKSSIDDLQLAKIKILGELPDIIFMVSNERLMELLKLLLSIPTPAPEKEIDVLGKGVPALEIEEANIKNLAKMRAIMEVDEISDIEEKLEAKKEEGEEVPQEKKTDVQQIQFEMNLTLNQVGVVIGTPDAIFLSIQIRRMGSGVQMRTFDMVAVAYLGDLTLEQPQYKSLIPGRDTLFLIDSTHSSDQNLLQFKYVQANKESPFFATEYNLRSKRWMFRSRR